MNKIIVIFLVFILVSCGESQNQNNEFNKEVADVAISAEDIEKMKYIDYVPDVKVAIYTDNWSKYSELENVISNLKLGDISYFQNNQEILQALLKDLKETIPQQLKTPAIESRLIALENSMYKLESLVNLSNSSKDEKLQVIKEVLEARASFNFQMNKKLERESQNIQKP